jgi:hypothetical protein
VRFWRKSMVPALAALAVAMLGAAGASGVDQMANARVTHPVPAAVPAAVPAVEADGHPPLRHLVLRGLAEGSLPGGFPYDEPREEKYDENYDETLHPAHASAGAARVLKFQA